jgi:hypothetical protein
MKKIFLYIATALLLVTGSCTKLDETLYSQIPANNFYNNKFEVMTAVLRPFTHARAWASMQDRHGYWRLQELTADQQAWPQKGRHGYDGAQWIRQHYHQWTVTDRAIEEPWELLYQGIGFCNNTLDDFESVNFSKLGITDNEKNALIAETKVIRAWHYLKLMDLYGNIPIVTTAKGGQPSNPPTVPRAEVFTFVEKEIKDNLSSLQPLSAAMVGRVSKPAAYAMLAELYVNAAVWSGTTRWDDCITACDSILLGDMGGLNGKVALDNSILTPFTTTNQLSKENLFQLAYDYRASGDAPSYNSVFWHYHSRQIYNAERDGNNEWVTTPNAYSAYKNNDQRKKEWFLFGLQYKHPDLRTSVADSIVLGSEEYDGKPLVFVNSIRRNSEGETGEGGMTRGEENSGARFNKYRPGTVTDPNYLGNDFVVYRLTEIYFFKAEALMRKNNGAATQSAVDLINQCKMRAFTSSDWSTEIYTTNTLTLDELLAERGREFIFEGKRRSDMIRFGKFLTATWWDHQPSNDTKWLLFPIPKKQRVINLNLKQNDGYE